MLMVVGGGLGLIPFDTPGLLPADTLLETSISPQGDRCMRLSLVAVSLQWCETSLKTNTSCLIWCISKGQRLTHTHILISRIIQSTIINHIPPTLPNRHTFVDCLVYTYCIHTMAMYQHDLRHLSKWKVNVENFPSRIPHQKLWGPNVLLNSASVRFS